MGYLSGLPSGLLSGRVVAAFVQTEMLGRLLGRLRTLDDYGLQRGSQQLAIVDIGSGDDDG